MIITIDGPAGSGKSTVASVLSKKLGFIHFNSGSLFRAITVYLRHVNFDFNTLTSESEIIKMALKVKFEDGNMLVFVNKLNCTPFLRQNDISILTPKVSTNKWVRKLVDDFQHQFAKNNNLVIDGRDIGSFVFPNADFKFYLDCSLEERAKRRFKEEVAKGNKTTLKTIEHQIAERDKIDKTKKYCPLVVPDGAIVINSTTLSVEQVVGLMLDTIKS